MRKIFFIILVMAVAMLQAKENRWLVNGNHSVQWETSKGELPYNDHIEMSGLRASVVYYWGVDGGKRFSMDRHLVFPMLRTIPNNTHASWMPRCDMDFLKGMTAIKLREEDPLIIGYITRNGSTLSEYGKAYVEELLKFREDI